MWRIAYISSADWTLVINTYPAPSSSCTEGVLSHSRARQARLSRLRRPLRTATVRVVEHAPPRRVAGCLAETSSYPPGHRVTVTVTPVQGSASQCAAILSGPLRC